jgi:choice-of-anchor B domain-containing protein
MQQMCMCGFLRDALLPQTELRSIQNTKEDGAQKVLGNTVPMIECIGNKAITDDQTYPCENVDLLSFLNLEDLGKAFSDSYVYVSSTSSLWGWYDDMGNEVALIGTNQGLSFVDVTTPTNPKYLGTLEPPSNGGLSFWRDVRVYQNYVYTVTENGNMQYLDMNPLLKLRDTNQIPENGLLLQSYASEFGNMYKTHTIYINEETGFAYLVGTNLCSGGLYMVNITIPSQPSFAGCFDDDGYTHEVQCTLIEHLDHELFFKHSHTLFFIGLLMTNRCRL